MKVFTIRLAASTAAAIVLLQGVACANDAAGGFCETATSRPLVAPQFSGPLPQAALPDCDATAMYYGFDRAPDYAAALQCAYYQRANPDATRADPFRGPGVLSMLYANGSGVRRDLDLAIRFTCESWAAPAEMRGRLIHLNAMRPEGLAAVDKDLCQFSGIDECALLAQRLSGLRDEPNRHGADFDLCDDHTSGMMDGICASIRSEFAKAHRNSEVSKLLAPLDSKAREAYARLAKSEEEYEEARSSDEIDLSGSGRGMFAIEEADRLQDLHIATLRSILEGKIAEANAATADALERDVQSAYDRVIHRLSSMKIQPGIAMGEFGSIFPEGVRHTQEVWRQLVAAWLDFRRVAAPSVEETRVHAQLARERLKQLRDLPN